jgi:hypothetical protein
MVPLPSRQIAHPTMNIARLTMNITHLLMKRQSEQSIEDHH